MSKQAKTNDTSDESKRANAKDAGDSDRASYAARADAAITDIEIDDLIRTITSYPSNAKILRRLKNNDPSLTSLSVGLRSRGYEYAPEARSMGWLGYFVGESTHLRTLQLDDLGGIQGDVSRDELLAFSRGLNLNRSVQHLIILDLGRLSAVLPALSRFFAESKNLVSVEVFYGNEDLDGSIAHRLSRTLRSCSCLKSFEFELVESFQEHGDEYVVEIIHSLSEKSNLEKVKFDNCLGRGGYRALADLLAWDGSRVKSLDVGYCEMDVEDFDCLLDAVASNGKLQKLNMESCRVRGGNYEDPTHPILIRTWGSVERPLLKAFVSNLVELDIRSSMDDEGSVDDEGAVAFSHALTGNRKLRVLRASWRWLTSRGWSALAKLLCDTSRPEATFLSNHTLQDLGLHMETNDDVTAVDSIFLNELDSLLVLNQNDDKARVASAKILKTHDDFDMQVFFGWEFKMLPIAVQWLATAITSGPSNLPADPNVQRRKLSVIYQFARGAPKLFAERRLRGELEEICARKESLRQEQERIRMELEWLEERKRTIHNKLRAKE